MRTLALIAATAVAVLAAPAAKADFFIWSDWGPGFGSYHYDPGQPRGTASTVAGWGDDLSEGQRRYWGGPFFVDKRGYHPPYQSHHATARWECRNEVVATADGSERRIRRCR